MKFVFIWLNPLVCLKQGKSCLDDLNIIKNYDCCITLSAELIIIIIIIKEGIKKLILMLISYWYLGNIIQYFSLGWK